MTPLSPLPFVYFDSLSDLLALVPQDSILSRTIYKDDQVNVVLFAFAQGQQLSEHTASVPAMIQILSGEAEVGLGTETRDAHTGTWIHMQARLPHSIIAKTPLTMLLILLQNQQEKV